MWLKPCDVTCCMWPGHPPQLPGSSSAAGWRSGCVAGADCLMWACLDGGPTWIACDWETSTAAAHPGLIHESLWEEKDKYSPDVIIGYTLLPLFFISYLVCCCHSDSVALKEQLEYLRIMVNNCNLSVCQGCEKKKATAADVKT